MTVLKGREQRFGKGASYLPLPMCQMAGKGWEGLGGAIAMKYAVLRIRIRRFRTYPMFLGPLDPDPLVRGTAPDLDPSIIEQK